MAIKKVSPALKLARKIARMGRPELAQAALNASKGKRQVTKIDIVSTGGASDFLTTVPTGLWRPVTYTTFARLEIEHTCPIRVNVVRR